MFEGSKNVPEGAFDRWLEAVGGDNNGSTQNDRTNYWENAPANALETAALPRVGPHGLPPRRDEPAEGGRPARRREERAAPGRREPAVRPGRGPDAAGALPEGPPVLVAGHRLDGGPLGRELPGRRRLLQAVVRARQREPRRRGRRGRGRGAAPRGEVVRGRAEERAGRRRSCPGRSCCGRRSASCSRTRSSCPASTSPGSPRPPSPRRTRRSTRSAAVLASGKNSRLYKRLVYELQVAQDVAAVQDSNALASTFTIEVTARAGPRPRGDPPPRRRGDRSACSRSRPRSGSSTRFQNQTEAGVLRPPGARGRVRRQGRPAERLLLPHREPGLLRGGPRPLPGARAERRAGRGLALPRRRAGSSSRSCPTGKKDLAVPEVKR